MQVEINNQKVEVEENKAMLVSLNELLKGKPLDEQIKLLKIRYDYYKWESEYGDESESYSYKQVDLSDCNNIIKVYVCDNTIVGVRSEIYGKTFDLVLDKQICVYSASEDDGPSCTSVTDYATLLLKE